MSTKTASALSVSASRPGIELPENYAELLEAGLDEVLRDDSKRPTEGGQFFRPVNMNKSVMKYQKTVGLGAAQKSRDAAPKPFANGQLGFNWELTVDTFRLYTQIERALLEDDLYDEVKRRQTDLVDAMRLTKELVMADVFNRSLGTAGAPVLAQDGMYLLDSARPKPVKKAGTWSNLEATSAITPTAIWTARQAANNMTDDNGQRTPMKIQHIVHRFEDSKALYEIFNSDQRPYDASNTANYDMANQIQLHCYSMLTSAVILYYCGSNFKDAKNELVFGNYVNPTVHTENASSDVVEQGIRARWGIGLGYAGMWRGGAVS